MDQCHHPRVIRDSPVTKNADYEFWMGISISCRAFKVSVCSSQLQKCLDLWIQPGGCSHRIQRTLLHKTQTDNLETAEQEPDFGMTYNPIPLGLMICQAQGAYLSADLHRLLSGI
ncbi:unnamed protein product [Rangifer tarandus platyrhynchus]|uniref:Uncharacterized protein n=1 Tax=Rangifer tarandus platyrhynchus TaxID=3082113 RepID=A0AC59ZRD4_RANTA